MEGVRVVSGRAAVIVSQYLYQASTGGVSAVWSPFKRDRRGGRGGIGEAMRSVHSGGKFRLEPL